MFFTSKHKLLIITVIVLLILIIFSFILNKFGAFKDFQQDIKNPSKCNIPPSPTNLRFKIRHEPNKIANSIDVITKIKWDRVKDATHYKIYCYRENPLKGALAFMIGDTSNHHNMADTKTIISHSLYNLKPGYYWFRVRAINDCGEGEFSDTISLTVS